MKSVLLIGIIFTIFITSCLSFGVSTYSLPPEFLNDSRICGNLYYDFPYNDNVEDISHYSSNIYGTTMFCTFTGFGNINSCPNSLILELQGENNVTVHFDSDLTTQYIGDNYFSCTYTADSSQTGYASSYSIIDY